MTADFLNHIQAPPQLRDFLVAMKLAGEMRDIPNISWDTAQFLFETLHARNIRSVLEIGPANGFSTMMLSLACPDAEVTSIEFSRHAFEELRANIQTFHSLKNSEEVQSPLPVEFGPKVTSDVFQQKIGNFSLYYGDAREILPAFLHGSGLLQCQHPKSDLRNIAAQKFDMIFIDGAFRMTQAFYDLSVPLLASGGIIIVDDAIKFRWKMAGFHEYLATSGVDFKLVQTDEDDGIMIIDGLK